MRINVIDTDTGNWLLDYRSAVIPKKDETVLQADSGEELIVEKVSHIITPHGEPYVDLHCKIT
jgi:hypothetical protein